MQRLGREGQRPADRRAEREGDGLLVQRIDRDVGPRGGRGARRVGALERLHRVDHVVGRDRHAVLPGRVVADPERPHLAGLVDRPRGGEVRDIRGPGAELHEAREDEPDEHPLGARPGGHWGHRLGGADDALAVVDGGGRRGIGVGSGRGASAWRGIASRPPMATRTSTRTRTTDRSRLVTAACGDRAASARRGAGSADEDEGHQREQHPEDEQEDGELPQPALDAAAAAVDGGVAAEGAGQAGPPRLEQDGGDRARC